MLTRHFYDRDAVAEALFTVLGQPKDPLRKPKALFWAHELVCSGEEEAARQVLDRVWLALGSPTYPLPSSFSLLEGLAHMLRSPVLPTPYPPPSSASAERAAVRAGALGLKTPAQPAKWTAEQRLCLAIAVKDAVKHRRGVRLYRLLAGLPHKIALQYLGFPKTPVGDGEGFQHVLTKRLGFPWISSDPLLDGGPLKWPDLPVGTLAARRFALPKGLVSKEPMEPSGFGVLGGCRVWQEALDKHGIDRETSVAQGSLVFRSDDAFEAFYAEFFAEDIPDEWSAAEKAKSHQ